MVIFIVLALIFMFVYLGLPKWAQVVLLIANILIVFSGLVPRSLLGGSLFSDEFPIVDEIFQVVLFITG